MADRQLLAGAATSNITPRLGTSINGNLQNHVAEQIHDELHARCLVLDNGVERLAIVVCDSCAIPGEVIFAAKHLVHGYSSFPVDRMLVSATHTHSAAAAVSAFQSDADLDYQVFLAERIADGIRRALGNLAPARIGWGVAQEPTQVFNRRWRMKPGTIPPNPFGETTDLVQMNPPRGSPNLVEPSGPTDPDVTVLYVERADGRPLALLGNYSLHYVGDVGGPGIVSADYFAAFADRVQQILEADRLDPPFVGILANGSSGNINNIDFSQRAPEPGPPYTRIRRVANLVAEAAHKAIDGAEMHDWAPLAMRESRIALARRLPTAADVERAKAILAEARGEQLGKLEEIYARETYLLAELEPEVETVVQAVRIGEMGIVALPCEVFVETGLALRADSPLKPTCTISLANDYQGYLPTPEHHRLGGYETWRARSSFLELDAEPKMRARALELLAEVTAG
jgi:hypothetical protein